MDTQKEIELFEELLLANPDFDESLLAKDEDGDYENCEIGDQLGIFQAGIEVAEREARMNAKAQVPEQVLNAPACVGGGTFQKGVKWSTVIGAAQRHYENDGHHERPVISIVDQLQLASGKLVLIEKKKLMQIIGSVSMIEPITHGNPYMDSIKRELTAITDVVKTVIEAREPAPLKLGDLVEPIDHRYTLASGCERYPYAYVVNTNPFQLMSEEGDMYWCCTVEAGGYKLIKSNNQLPEAVSLRMIREGLLAPVETQEQSHD